MSWLMQTCDGNFSGPFACAVEDALSHCFHVPRMALFVTAKYGSELLGDNFLWWNHMAEHEQFNNWKFIAFRDDSHDFSESNLNDWYYSNFTLTPLWSWRMWKKILMGTVIKLPCQNFFPTPSNIYLSNSNISGLSQTRCFMRSCIAVITDCALSSAPCLELFSAAPAKHTEN